MLDGQGRVIDYIRISVTDRCDLRCVYCMPEAGVKALGHEAILRYEEIVRLVRVFIGLGLIHIKITGGEPLARRGLPSLIADLKALPGIGQVSLTTNAVQLGEQMAALAAAGIDAINISLDSLNPLCFKQITRKDLLPKVLASLNAALEYPDIPLKINCVPLGLPEQDLMAMAELARAYPIHVRYIEMMPIGQGKSCVGQKEADILADLERRFGRALPFTEKLGQGPSRYYRFEGFKGKIGFISALSHQFCASCNRVRLTSDGFLKSCLQFDEGVELKSALRGGADDAALASLIQESILRKPVSHRFFEKNLRHGENKNMSQIGG